MKTLPDAKQLERLTLRAIVAYARRAARHSAVVLRGSLEHDLVEAALRIAENFTVSPVVDPLGTAINAASAAASITGAMPRLATRESKIAALCLTRVAMATVAACRALNWPADSEQARREAARAAREAANIARAAETTLGAPNARPNVISDAARRDFGILARNFGEHDVVVLGAPIDSAIW
jgi:hypothetical protein